MPRFHRLRIGKTPRECVSTVGADYIVSGDKHLLKGACYKKTQIVPVNEFLQIIEAKR